MEIESSASSSKGVPKMLHRFLVLMVGLLGAALAFPANPFAQNPSAPTWPDPVPNRPPIAEKDKKPAPRRNLVGMWGSRSGNRQATNQSASVQLKPSRAARLT